MRFFREVRAATGFNFPTSNRNYFAEHSRITAQFYLPAPTQPKLLNQHHFP